MTDTSENRSSKYPRGPLVYQKKQRPYVEQIWRILICNVIPLMDTFLISSVKPKKTSIQTLSNGEVIY